MAAQLLFGAGNSVTGGTVGTATSGSINCSKAALSNIQVGDLLVAWMADQLSTAGNTITAPSGWVHYGADPGTPTWSASRTAGIFYYPIKSQADISALPSTLTWSFAFSGGRCAGVIARATGIDLDAIEDSAATQFTNTTNVSSLPIASITTTSATTLLVGGLHHQNAALTSAVSTTGFMTAFVEYRTSTSDNTIANTGAALGYTYLTAAGATGTMTATYDNTINTCAGELVAFKAGPWSPTPPPNPGVSTHYTSALNTLGNASLFYTSATDTLATPLEVRPVPTGYASVAAMLATPNFCVAHRGGSLNWPEMSLYAYSQSVFWGVGAVEISLARSSDGVWFGLHDATLDRTSGTSSYTASIHTWSEIQAYQITAAGTNNSGQATRPYMRWEELMSAYYSTHVIFVDPKVASAYTSELLNMMDAMPGSPTDRFVAKYYGVSSGWPTQASARGYKTWGYFYQADVPNLPTYQGRWDILGMDYGANASSWSAVLSYGKPVIGHIIPSAIAATTAFSLGAVGLMVSGVKEAIPRSANPAG